MKKIFIGSALRGDYEQNLSKARSYCSKAASKGFLPLAPHIIFTQFLDDDDEYDREKGILMGLELMRTCVNEAWFFGEITEGMQREINLARELELPVRRFDKEGEKTNQINYYDQVRQMALIAEVSEEVAAQYIDAEDDYYRMLGLITEPGDEGYGEPQESDVVVDDDKLFNYIHGTTGIDFSTYQDLSNAEYVFLSEFGLIHDSKEFEEESYDSYRSNEGSCG